MSKKSKKVWAKLIANPGSGDAAGRGQLLEQVTRSLKDQGVKAEYARQFDNIETVKRVVEIGLGVAILPEATIRGEVVKQTMAAVRLEGNYFRPLAVIYKKGKVLSPAMKQFIKLLKETP